MHKSGRESTRVQHESIRINRSPRRANTSQLDQEIIIVYRILVVRV